MDWNKQPEREQEVYWLYKSASRVNISLRDLKLYNEYHHHTIYGHIYSIV